MGKTPADLVEITWKELILAIEGYFAGQKDEARRARAIAWYVYRGNCDPEKGIKDIESFWSIDEDPKPAYKAPAKKTLIKYDKIFRKLTQNLK